MLCDHCNTDTNCIIDAYFEITLCWGCNDRHHRKVWLEKDALRELEYQQRMMEAWALPFHYDS